MIETIKQTIRQKEAESGQAIVLIAVLMVILLGMLGMAIDGGGLFLLWRDARNAADTAALQAAYARCTSPIDSTYDLRWQQAGYDAADENGFTNSANTTVVVSNATIDGTDYTEVEITAVKPSYFIQLLYPGDLEVQATALSSCARAFDSGSLPGLFARGGPNSCGGANMEIDWSGSDLTIEGDVYSAGGVNFNPNGSSGAYIDGDVTYEDADTSNTGKVNYAPGHGSSASTEEKEFPFWDLSMYAPGGAIAAAVVAHPQGQYTHYTSDWNVGGGVLEGLYYVEGDVTQNGSPSFTVGDEGFTIIATGQIGFSTTGSYSVPFNYYELLLYDGTDLGGLDGDPNTNPNAYTQEFTATDGYRYPGFIYATEWSYGTAESGWCTSSAANAAIDIGGQSDILGIVYAPNGTVNFSLNNMVFEGAILSWSMSGSMSSGKYIFVEELLPDRPPIVARPQ